MTSDRHTGIPESYIHDDNSTLTLRHHASRTAGAHAGWFLPYLRRGMTLLDCGCASGSITVGLADAVAPGHVIGIDISEVEIDRARARAQQGGVGNVAFATGDVYQLDFSDDSFDAVFSHNVLEHLADPRRALIEMRRVLEPGGVVGLRDFDMGGVLYAPHTELIQQFLSIYEADWVQTNGHPRLARELIGLLAETAFDDIAATASYEAYSGAEGLKYVASLIVGRLSDEAFAKRVVERSMATVDDIRAMKKEATAWQDQPGAFFALSHVEVVGRKP